MTDEQWIRLNIRNAQAQRRQVTRNVAGRLGRLLHGLLAPRSQRPSSSR